MAKHATVYRSLCLVAATAVMGRTSTGRCGTTPSQRAAGRARGGDREVRHTCGGGAERIGRGHARWKDAARARLGLWYRERTMANSEGDGREVLLPRGFTRLD
jgi:hypothetical protein